MNIWTLIMWVGVIAIAILMWYAFTHQEIEKEDQEQEETHNE